MRALEALVFLPLAAGIHLGLWAMTPERSGAKATASAGKSQVTQITLAASTPQYAAMVQTWQTPPRIAPAPEPLVAASVPGQLPRLPLLQNAPTRQPATALAPLTPAAQPVVQPMPVQSLTTPAAPATPVQPRPGGSVDLPRLSTLEPGPSLKPAPELPPVAPAVQPASQPAPPRTHQSRTPEQPRLQARFDAPDLPVIGNAPTLMAAPSLPAMRPANQPGAPSAPIAPRPWRAPDAPQQPFFRPLIDPPKLAALVPAPTVNPARPQPQPPAPAQPPALPPALAPTLSPALPTALPQLDPTPPEIPTLRNPRPPEPARSGPVSTSPRPKQRPKQAQQQPKPARPGPVAKADAPPAPSPKPEPKPQKARPAPAQSASGGGKASRPKAGQTGRDATQSVNAATRRALQSRWGAKIQARVHRRLVYPRGARGTGSARVSLTIDRAGRLVGLRLTRSSGVAAFDRAALNAVRRAGRFPKAPPELRKASYSFSLSLSFRP